MDVENLQFEKIDDNGIHLLMKTTGNFPAVSSAGFTFKLSLRSKDKSVIGYSPIIVSRINMKEGSMKQKGFVLVSVLIITTITTMLAFSQLGENRLQERIAVINRKRSVRGFLPKKVF